MNFDILFSRYCSLLENKKQKMPLKTKFALTLFVLFMLVIATLFLFYIFNTKLVYLASFLILLTIFLIFLLFLAFKNKENNVDTENERENSEKYIKEVIEVLESCGVNTEKTDVLNLLIEEAKEKQKSNFSVSLNKAITILSSLYYLIVTLVCKALYDKYGFWKLIIFLVFAVFFFFIISMFFQFVKSFTKQHFEFKYMKHNKFVYDLKQIKIFYNTK